MAAFHTYGYEGLAIQEFLQRLGSLGVETLVDVRELPLSRKKGFSKKALADHLASANIAYCHMPGLGCPKPIREKYKQDGNWGAYEKAFKKYLGTRDADIQELAETAEAARTCIICFEADVTRCHRRMVANAVVAAAPKLKLVHIIGQTVKTESAL